MTGPPCSTAAELQALLPDRPVHLFVERRAAGRKLPQGVVLGPHQGRAVAERPADALALQPAVLAQLLDEVRLRQCRPADAGEGDPVVADVGRRRLRQELLQVALA